MSECTCGAKTMQPEYHKFGCPYRHSGSMAQYTTPRFEDGTVGHADREARRRLNDAELLQEQAQTAVDEARSWVDLSQEMNAVGATVIAELPSDRVQYWKSLLHKPPMIRISG